VPSFFWVLLFPDPKPVLEALRKEEGVKLVAIFTTHKHWCGSLHELFKLFFFFQSSESFVLVFRDHSGGNHRLLKEFPDLKIYGSALDAVPSGNQRVHDDDVIKVGSLVFRALESRVHTRGHLLFLLDQPHATHPPALFSGDAVFVGGAGKFFESTALDLYLLIERLKRLDQRTLLFPGHEYTLSNLTFAEALDTSNETVRSKLEWTKSRRTLAESTIPSTLAEEFTYNPFFRASEPAVRQGLPPFPASSSEGSTQEETVHYIGEVRKAKDLFSSKK